MYQRIEMIPCELFADPVELRYELASSHGPDDGAHVQMIWRNVMDRAMHFDLLKPTDALQAYSRDQLSIAQKVFSPKGVPRIFDAFLTQFWNAFWNAPLFPIKQDPF